ncbi:MAG: hypothetical protein SFY66_28275 [Oculatellaceae cyanobacterium bins.114]|nr:hypothetical protein [Oculatellaceae cyanobacterium bins.114]
MVKSIQSLTGREFHRLGRFLAVRKAYSFIQHQRQRGNETRWKDNLKIQESSLFQAIAVNQCVNEIRQEAVCFGLQLPEELIVDIDHYARTTPCKEPGFQDLFLIDEVQEGRLRGGRPVLRGLVNNTQDCKAIALLEQDPTLIEIVRSYLGYYPTQITRHLTWSIVSHLPDRGKPFYPPTTFHYDIAGFNFMTTYFYITDVDAESGAHVMIRGSHVQKPWWMVLSSGRQSDQAVYRYYGKAKELVIEGKRGFGFIQDPSCIHRVLPPIKANRLLLQLRYA